MFTKKKKPKISIKLGTPVRLWTPGWSNFINSVPYDPHKDPAGDVRKIMVRKILKDMYDANITYVCDGKLVSDKFISTLSYDELVETRNVVMKVTFNDEESYSLFLLRFA